MFASLIAFLVAIALLVTVHEFGHFWVARRAGVRVINFSMGFGPKLFNWSDSRQTEYCVRLIPLGGYVKLLDEYDGPLPAKERASAFNRQPARKKIAIVLAGPAANFLLAILLFFVIYTIGFPGIAPIIGDVEQHSHAAQVGLLPGDEIIAVNGQSVQTWREVHRLLSTTVDAKTMYQLIVVRQDSDHEYQVELPHIKVPSGNLMQGLQHLGIRPGTPPLPPIIGGIVATGPAANSELNVGDRILTLDDVSIDSWRELVNAIRARPNQTVTMTLMRAGHTHQVVLRIGAVADQRQVHGQLGIYFSRAALPNNYFRTQRLWPDEALKRSIVETGSIAWSTLSLTVRMLFGQSDLSQLGGPISMAKGAGDTAQAGLVAYLSFLALLSISLGVINLLPIPILDGGHLVYHVLESIRGRPLSAAAQQLTMTLGLSFLFCVMVLAIYNDVSRLS